jgi:CRISPR-associated protein Cas5h
MKIIAFDVKGAFAHFRKFYANSTSLSYDFPPRTVVCGIIAAILGLERDSYYELFSEADAKIAVQILQPIKRISQTVNYLWVKKLKDLNASSGHLQVPVEWVVNKDGIGLGSVAYRVFFAHKDQSLQQELLNRIVKGESVFPVCLGVTEALAAIDCVGNGEFLSHTFESDGGLLEISTVCPVHKLRQISYSQVGNERRTYMRDRIPCAFLPGRSLSSITQVLYEPNGYTILSEVKSCVQQLEINNRITNILFLEGNGGEEI